MFLFFKKYLYLLKTIFTILQNMRIVLISMNSKKETPQGTFKRGIVKNTLGE